ncbi:MAG TPA: hypothetical protein VGM81_25780 [Burkholderiaceae bacterium]|jgi:hypothetical protein
MRIAYVVEDGIDSHAWLDEIFGNCFGRHGGRQSLIVPVVNGEIADRYKTWLRLLDPDHLVLLTYDNAAWVEPLARLLADTKLHARPRVRDAAEPHPRVAIEPQALSSVSWLPFMKVVSGRFRAAPGFILDKFPSWPDDGLVKDNFGTLANSLYPFPMHDQIGVPPLMMTPPNAPENRWNFRISGGEEMQDGYAMVERLSNAGNVVTLAQLSNMSSQPFRVTHPWNESFCVVIGDSFLDRVSCWNAALLYGDAHTQALKTMRLPAAAAGDNMKLAQIGSYLARRNLIDVRGQGPTQVTVRSHSLTADQLEAVAVQLREATRWAQVGVRLIGASDECCPEDERVVAVRGRFSPFDPQDSTESRMTDQTSVVSVARPFHMGYTVGQHPFFARGDWYIDLTIDRQGDGVFTNLRDEWVLPNRPGLTRRVCSSPGARLLRHGRIACPVNVERGSIEISCPTDDEVIRSLLTQPVLYDHNDARSALDRAASYRWAAASDKGRYLQGTLGMFQSLDNAARVLGGHFWRSQFLRMASPALDQKQDIINDLKARLRAENGPLVVADDEGWERLAQRVIEKVGRLRKPRERIRFKDLLTDWTAELQQAVDADGNLARERERVMSEAKEELERSLGHLLECGVFYRGHAWSCRHCSHANWAAVDALSGTLDCEVCATTHQLPVDLTLDFRLNEFFSACLREHDTLAVIWALSELRRRSNSLFIYGPQMNLYEDYPENQGERPNRELDVVGVADGKFVVGEVKVDVRLISDRDIADLADAAGKVGADRVVLMALRGDPAALERKVDRLRQLVPAHIKVEGIVSDWTDEPSAYL